MWWPANTLYEYWEKQQMVSESVESEPNPKQEVTPAITLDEDAEMCANLAKFIALPTRLDTSHIAVAVWDLSSNTSVLEWHNEELMVPASSLKMLTAISALKRLGPNHSYMEKLLVTGKQEGGTLHGDVILQADDNPLVETLDEYVNAGQLETLNMLLRKAEITEEKFCEVYKIAVMPEFPAAKYDEAVAKLEAAVKAHKEDK